MQRRPGASKCKLRAIIIFDETTNHHAGAIDRSGPCPLLALLTPVTVALRQEPVGSWTTEEIPTVITPVADCRFIDAAATKVRAHAAPAHTRLAAAC